MTTNTEKVPRRLANFVGVRRRIGVIAALILAVPSHLLAQSAESGTTGGVSAIWIFSNLSFTGMRAQNTGGTFWKVVTFIFGFPGTLLTLILVDKGSERAYGIDMPKRSDQARNKPAPRGVPLSPRPPGWKLPEG